MTESLATFCSVFVEAVAVLCMYVCRIRWWHGNVCARAAELESTVIKNIHQVMTVLPGSAASLDPGQDQGNDDNGNQTRIIFYSRVPFVSWCNVIHLQTMCEV